MLIVAPFSKIWEIVVNGSSKMRQEYPEGVGLPSFLLPLANGKAAPGARGTDPG